MNDTIKKKKKKKVSKPGLDAGEVKRNWKIAELSQTNDILFGFVIVLVTTALILGFYLHLSSDKVDHLEVIVKETEVSNDLFMKDMVEARNKFFRLEHATTNMAIREIGAHEDYYNSSSVTIRLDNRKLIRRIDGSFVITGINDDGNMNLIPAAGPFKDLKEVLKYMNENNYVQLD